MPKKISRNIFVLLALGFTLSVTDLSAQSRSGKADEPSRGGSAKKTGKILYLCFSLKTKRIYIINFLRKATGRSNLEGTHARRMTRQKRKACKSVSIANYFKNRN